MTLEHIWVPAGHARVPGAHESCTAAPQARPVSRGSEDVSDHRTSSASSRTAQRMSSARSRKQRVEATAGPGQPGPGTARSHLTHVAGVAALSVEDAERVLYLALQRLLFLVSDVQCHDWVRLTVRRIDWKR